MQEPVHTLFDSKPVPEALKPKRTRLRPDTKPRLEALARAHGITPLHQALLAGHLAAAERLLAHGADANAMSALGTPLFLAVEQVQPPCAIYSPNQHLQSAAMC